MAESVVPLDRLVELARQAGAEILAINPDQAGAQTKADASPVTLADRAADRVIYRGLQSLYPGIPVVSEERELPAGLSGRFFLVDPLDGTKEFLTGSGEYTVNIAYLEDSRPVLGVVVLPVKNLAYWGDVRHKKAWRRQGNEPVQAISPAAVFGGRLAVSKSHQTAEEKVFAAANGFDRILEAGSSLKGCLVADGSADCYVRFGLVFGWDIAAMEAVLHGAGARLTTLGGQPIDYSQPGERISTGFLAAPPRTGRFKGL